eukprot:gene8491-11350_t
MHFLGKNMDWAKMLAEDKNINIIVEDSTAMSNVLAGDIEQGSVLATNQDVQPDAYLNVKFTPTNGTVSIKCTTELLSTSNQNNIISR